MISVALVLSQNHTQEHGSKILAFFIAVAVAIAVKN